MQKSRDSFLWGGMQRGGGYTWSRPAGQLLGLSTDGVYCDVDLSSISQRGLIINWKDPGNDVSSLHLPRALGRSSTLKMCHDVGSQAVLKYLQKTEYRRWN